MKIKNIIGECLIKMGKPNFVNEPILNIEQRELIASLLCAFNIIYRDAIVEYAPLVFSQSVAIKDGVLQTSTLKKSILYPITLKKGDENIKFKTYADRIECNFSGEATLKYAYMIDCDFLLDDEIDDMRMPQGALADGTLGEYYFENKIFDLAKSFDTDYRAVMSMLKYKGRRFRIKARGWQN